MKPKTVYYECPKGCQMTVGKGNATYGRWGKPGETVKCGCCGGRCRAK